MIRRLAPLFSLVLALSCGSPTGTIEPFALDEPFWIKVGDTMISADGGTVVHFVRVVTDSRCGAGMLCIWAGEAIIEVEVYPAFDTSFEPAVARIQSGDSPGGESDTAAAHLSIAIPRYEVKVGDSEPVVAFDRRILALALDPQGVGAPAPNQRRARLRISLLPAP